MELKLGSEAAKKYCQDNERTRANRQTDGRKAVMNISQDSKRTQANTASTKQLSMSVKVARGDMQMDSWELIS